MKSLILSASEVDSAVAQFSADDLVTLMARVFYRLSKAHKSTQHHEAGSTSPIDLSLPHRLSVPTSNHSVLFMPSRISPFGTGIKVVSVPTASSPPDIRSRGLPATTLIFDDSTGAVRAILNASKLTALRNAAGSLLSARLLIPSDTSPKTIVAFGAGAQISAHISLFLKAYPTIDKCTIVNRSENERLKSLLSTLRAVFPQVQLESLILPADSDDKVALSSVVKTANVIITATSSKVPLFPSNFVSSGTHLCLIGSYTPEMHEVDVDLVKRAGIILVDSKDACKTEAGELISAGIQDDDMVEIGEAIEISDVAEGSQATEWIAKQEKVQKVKAGGDVTIFKSVGVGIQDVAIAHAVVEQAEKHSIGQLVEL